MSRKEDRLRQERERQEREQQREQQRVRNRSSRTEKELLVDRISLMSDGTTHNYNNPQSDSAPLGSLSLFYGSPTR